jgi:hypothetical protein
MSNGIRTTNLERSFVIDELIGNITADGVEKTARLPLEALANQLAGTGPFIFGNTVYALTKAALDAFTPASEHMGGLVLTGADAGYYARISGVWVFGRGFPDSIARLTVTGGSANSVQATANVGVNPSDVAVYFIEPTLTNNGPVDLTISGSLARPVTNVNGDALAAGEWRSGRRMLLTDEGDHYRLLSDPDIDAILQTAIDLVNDATQLTTPGDNTVNRPKLSEPLSSSVAINPKEFGAAGDGVADDTAAFLAALATGKDVFIPTGMSIKFNTATVTNQRIYGGGKLVKTGRFGLLLSGSAWVDGLKFDGVVENSLGQDSEIKILGGATARITNCYFTPDHATDSYSAIIAATDPLTTNTDYPFASNVKSALIDGNHFDGYHRPVQLACVDDFTITSNYFTGCAADAIRTRETLGHGIISDNTFFECGDQSWPDEQTRDCIDTAFGGMKLIIANNVMIRPAQVGIDIKGISFVDSAGSSRNIIIEGNYIEGSRRAGISIAQGEAEAPDFIWGFVVANNIILRFNQNNAAGAGGVADAGISCDRQVRNISIVGNQIMGGYGRGINLPGAVAPDTAIRNTIITGNQVFNNLDTAINLGNANGAVVTGNIVGNDNQPYASATATGAGHTGAIIPSGGGHTAGFTFAATIAAAKYTTIFTGNIVRSVSGQPVIFAGTGSWADAFAQYAGNQFIDCGAFASTQVRWAASGKRQFHGTGTAPAANDGTFLQGDIIWNTAAPAAGGFIGLVCVAAGNPGTWKTFGAISA